MVFSFDYIIVNFHVFKTRAAKSGEKITIKSIYLLKTVITTFIEIKASI